MGILAMGLFISIWLLAVFVLPPVVLLIRLRATIKAPDLTPVQGSDLDERLLEVQGETSAWSPRVVFYSRLTGVAAWGTVPCCWGLWSLFARIIIVAAVLVYIRVSLFWFNYGFLLLEVQASLDVPVYVSPEGMPAPASAWVICAQVALPGVILLQHLVFARVMGTVGPIATVASTSKVACPLVATAFVTVCCCFTLASSLLAVDDDTLPLWCLALPVGVLHFVTAPVQILTTVMANQEMAFLTKALSECQAKDDPTNALREVRLHAKAVKARWSFFLSNDLFLCICSLVICAARVMGTIDWEDARYVELFTVCTMPFTLTLSLLQIQAVTRHNSLVTKLKDSSDADPSFWIMLAQGDLNVPICGIAMSKKYFKGLLITGVFAIAQGLASSLLNAVQDS